MKKLCLLKWQLIIFVYWSDGLGDEHYHSRNGGRGICQQNLPAEPAFDQFFQMPGVCPGFFRRGLMLAARIESHIISKILNDKFQQ